MTNENISPANIGGMGPVSLPSGDTVGSGDVPAGRGDAKKNKKKKKMLFSTFNEFVNERYRADEGTFQGNEIAIYNCEDGETYIEKRGKGYYGYNNEFDFTAKNKKELEQKLNGWGYYKIAGSLDEAKIRDAREDLGYVAFLEEMADLNSKDLQAAYDAAIEVLEDKGMSEKQAIGFLNSPHGKYMGEYLVPGMDYSHEAFLDKLDEYYNERMLKKYAKDYANLG